MTAGEKTRIKSVARISEIVQLLQEEGPLGITEIADQTGLPTSTVHDYVGSLYEMEYVVKSEKKKYDLGLRFLDHGMSARENRPISTVGQSSIEQLAEVTGEAVWIVVEEHGKAVYVNRALGDRAVETARIGTRSDLHCLASGKAILAHLSDDRVEEIINQHGLSTRTDRTVGTRESLYDELEAVRERGYAMNEGEAVEGVRAVGTPVLVGGDIAGAVSVSGPANRMTDDRLEDEILVELLGATNELEVRLGRHL